MEDLSWCYRELGLDPGASAAEVKQAWRDLAQVWHPDRFPSNERLQRKAVETLQRINDAYERLRRGPGPTVRPMVWRDAPAAAAEQEALAALARGVNAWNLWRKKYADQRPTLRGASLRKFSLESVDFREVDLSAADLEGADLYKANLSGAILRRTRLSRADLSRSFLVGADLGAADLLGANLSGANFNGAILFEAMFQDADLTGAQFEGADLRRAYGLEPRQLASAFLDGSTRLA